MKRKHLIVLAAVLMAAVATLNGDTIHLTNGRTVEGRVISQGDVLVLELPAGGRIEIPSSTVVRIETGPTPHRERQI